jgi:hypothetical protein
MADAVDTFRRFVWLIAKWLLVSMLSLIAFAAAVAGAIYSYQWYTVERHEKAVDFIVSTDRKNCADDKFPIYVLIGNRSTRTLERATFTLSARIKGRSSDLARYHSYVDDHISGPDQGFANCWASPELTEKVEDVRTLEWTISLRSVRFRD